jgi:hypothetical protein
MTIDEGGNEGRGRTVAPPLRLRPHGQASCRRPPYIINVMMGAKIDARTDRDRGVEERFNREFTWDLK